MATNHTTNYNLNLWEANDKFVREEFNENTSKLDAAIKAEADARATADTAINTTLAQKAQIAVGHYTGNNAATRFISVGFTPKAVLVIAVKGYTYQSSSYGSATCGGLAVTGHDSGNATPPAVQIVSGGFNVSYQDRGSCSNENNEGYNYIALG